MIQNFYPFLRIMLLVCFLPLFFSCEIEEEYTKTKDYNYKIKRVSFDEFKSKSAVFEKFKRVTIPEKNLTTGRIVYDEQFGLYYDIDKIIIY